MGGYRVFVFAVVVVVAMLALGSEDVADKVK